MSEGQQITAVLGLMAMLFFLSLELGGIRKELKRIADALEKIRKEK